MLLPSPMTRVLVVGPRSFQRQAVDLLYERRVIHLEDYTPPEGETVVKLGTPLEGAERASALLVKMRAFKTALGIEKAPPPARPLQASDIEGKIEASAVALGVAITSVADDKARIEQQINEVKGKIEELRPFAAVPVPLSLLGGYGSLAVFAGTLRAGYEQALSSAVRHFDVIEAAGDSELKVIFVDAPSRERAVKVLLDNGYQEVRVPSGQRTAAEELKDLEAALSDTTHGLVGRLEAKAKELDALREKHAPFILAATELLEMEAERCETPLRGAVTPGTFILEGYVPSEKVAPLKQALEGASGGRIHFDSEDVAQLAPPSHGHGPGGHGEEHKQSHGAAAEASRTPVALRNPKRAGAYEYLTRLISLPKYNEVDPTMLMFVVFPVYFGIMLGDIGYGMAVMFLGWLASRQRNVDLNAVGRLLMGGGLMSIVFGFLFGEFMGFEVFGSEPGPLKFWAHDIYVPALVGLVGGFDGYFPISRLHSVPMLLSATLWIGIIHIFFGFVIGFRNQLRAHGFSHAFYAKGSWIIVLVSGVVWVRAMTGVMFSGGDLGSVTGDPAFLGGISLFFIGFILLIKGEGVVGAVELPSLLGNILSYSRLLAIGLSGVAIALTANLPLAWAISDGGAVAWVVGGLLSVLGHLLAIFLGILGPGLHSLRLHYVEFFTKFYVGGGRPFQPLGKEPQYVAVR
jgi:V/A-type H+-transporting ATPase subunit I